jgi:uncharacterized membrane protein
MTTDIGGVPETRSKWLYRGLVASLALNLLFAGGLGAAAWHHRHGPRGDDIGLMGFARQLPQDRQKIVLEDITTARQTIRPLRKAVREAWDDANAVLTQEPFDKEKYKASMARLTDTETRHKTAVASALADTAAKLTAEERKSLQVWREKRRPHMFGRHGHREGADRDDKSTAAPDDKK